MVQSCSVSDENNRVKSVIGCDRAFGTKPFSVLLFKWASHWITCRRVSALILSGWNAPNPRKKADSEPVALRKPGGDGTWRGHANIPMFYMFYIFFNNIREYKDM